MYNLVIFGPPGAGKGTQSEKIIEKYKLAHISTGDMFRMHITNDTDLGKKVKQILADGLLVPDSITIEMLEEEVKSKPDVKGFIFDGFPRTVPQADSLDRFLVDKGLKINLVLQLDVNQDVIKERIAERQKVSGRADDDADKLVKGENYVILPLYGIHKKEKFVFERSGLNQWNARGRPRDFGELYINIPIILHKNFPDFFPPRDENFNLEIPTGEIFSAKVCQDNSKALMTNPNKSLSDWLLRKVLQLKEGELATMEKLDKLGFDSVIVTKESPGNFKIDIMKTNSAISFYEGLKEV
jgi:adenylate kinase family enzyme